MSEAVRTQMTKLAWKRNPDVPAGQPALGRFDCVCGNTIHDVEFGGPERTCACGRTWDGRGWLVHEWDGEPLEDCTVCDGPIFEGQRVDDYAGCVAHYGCVPA